MTKFAVWTREDLDENKPINVQFFIADSICVSGDQLNIISEDESIVRISMKDVCMVDFDLKGYVKDEICKGFN